MRKPAFTALCFIFSITLAQPQSVDDQLTYCRAVQAVVWGNHLMRHEMLSKTKGKLNSIRAWDCRMSRIFPLHSWMKKKDRLGETCWVH